eukprot:COSAG01_NODE_19484_length_1007_cov_2.098018_1_plen_188_part_00
MCSCHRHGGVGRRPVAVSHRPCTRRHAVPEGWSGNSPRSKPARQWRPQRGAPEAAWGPPGMPFQQGALLARWHVPGPSVPCEPTNQLNQQAAAGCCGRCYAAAELYRPNGCYAAAVTTTCTDVYSVRSSSVAVCIEPYAAGSACTRLCIARRSYSYADSALIRQQAVHKCIQPYEWPWPVDASETVR